MKRIINMLLNMIWPALILFILLVAEVFVRELRLYTIYRYTDGNSVLDTSILISEEWVEPLIGITGFLAVAFWLAFIAGVVWNIVYSIKHKEE